MTVGCSVLVYSHGHTRRSIRVDLIRSMRPYVLELGLASETELDELFAEALAHLDNPEVVVMPNLSFLVSGRKPDTIWHRCRLRGRGRECAGASRCLSRWRLTWHNRRSTIREPPQVLQFTPDRRVQYGGANDKRSKRTA